MIAKFTGLKAIVTLGDERRGCTKEDVLELIRRTGFKLIDIDFKPGEEDPELLNILADSVLTPQDEAMVKRIETESTAFIDQIVDQLWEKKP